MILVLDACTISNLINAFQDNSLIQLLPKAFREVHIASEVTKELEGTKAKYLNRYNRDWTKLNLTYSSCNLPYYKSRFDVDKNECSELFRRFFIAKGATVKLVGEYYSSLLSLYLSRLGVSDFSENANKILFATDDAKAENTYNQLFSANQIGQIIDSIDIAVIFYLKDLITKRRAVDYIASVYSLYNQEMDKIKQLLTVIKEKERDAAISLALTQLMEHVTTANFEELESSLNERIYRKAFSKYSNLKDLIKEILSQSLSSKISYAKNRQNELLGGLVWKP